MRDTTATWVIDPLHTEVQFKVRHLSISMVTGRLEEFSGEVIAEEHFGNARIEFEANVASLSTNNEQRDAHLKSADFFDVKKYPVSSFVSTSFIKQGMNIFQLDGVLTIKEISKEVILDVVYGGTMTDPWGNTKAGFAVKGKINRKDFGLTWSATTENGGILIGDEIIVRADVQLIKQLPPPAIYSFENMF